MLMPSWIAMFTAAVALYCRSRARLPVLQKRNKIQQYEWTYYTCTSIHSVSITWLYTLIYTYGIATSVPVSHYIYSTRIYVHLYHNKLLNIHIHIHIHTPTSHEPTHTHVHNYVYIYQVLHVATSKDIQEHGRTALASKADETMAIVGILQLVKQVHVCWLHDGVHDGLWVWVGNWHVLLCMRCFSK